MHCAGKFYVGRRLYSYSGLIFQSLKLSVVVQTDKVPYA